MELKDSFKCKHLRGDGRCRLKQRSCNKGHCGHYFKCSECEYGLYTGSQEPCNQCYFSTKASMLEYIQKNTK